MDLLKGLLGAKAAFSKLESAIFGAVESKLAPDVRELWAKQLQAVTRIVRIPDGSQVNLYVKRNGKLGFPQDLLFRNRDDFKVAVVDLKAAHTAAKLRARVWCSGGHVFSIEYKTSAKTFEQVAQGEWEAHCHIVTPPT